MCLDGYIIATSRLNLVPEVQIPAKSCLKLARIDAMAG